MPYKQSIDYLFGLQKFGIKLGLENISRLLSLLGNPHKSLNCIHVAGTNGKGSTCAFLQSIFSHAGYAAGLYTSPHLTDFTERIRINDDCIPKAAVADLVSEIKKICKKNALTNITFFEFTTAMAFHYFRLRRADPVIVETGLGGRWDATNVIIPRVSIITSISMEHEQYLGSKIRDIAGEKAGIIKPGVPLVSGVCSSTAQDVFMKRCFHQGSTLLVSGRDFTIRKRQPGDFSFKGLGVTLPVLHSGLLGDHQFRNAALALAGALVMDSYGYRIDANSMSKGIQAARWPGRLEQLCSQPTVIADGAHNPQGWRTLKKAISTYFHCEKQIFILGAMQDKAIDKMLKILTHDAYAIIVCRPRLERAAGMDFFEKFISFSSKKRVFWIEKSTDAYSKALSLAGEKDIVCITGSLFLVGELREAILKNTACSSGRIPM
jgi:dihydrofolate synthase / folylpolyglutamate synthase